MPQPRTTPKLHFQEITCKCHNYRSHYCEFPTTLKERPGAGGNWVSRRRYNLAVTYIQPRYGIINLSFNEWLNIFHVYKCNFSVVPGSGICTLISAPPWGLCHEKKKKKIQTSRKFPGRRDNFHVIPWFGFTFLSKLKLFFPGKSPLLYHPY